MGDREEGKAETILPGITRGQAQGGAPGGTQLSWKPRSGPSPPHSGHCETSKCQGKTRIFFPELGVGGRQDPGSASR